MDSMKRLRERVPTIVLNLLKFLAVFAGTILLLLTVLHFTKYVVPFLLALLIAAMAEPLVKLLGEKCRLGRAMGALAALIIIIGLIGLIIWLGGGRLISETRDFIADFDDNVREIVLSLNHVIDDLTARFSFIPVTLAENVKASFADLDRIIAEVVGNVDFGDVIDIAKAAPRAIVSFIVTIVAAFFMMRDRKYIFAYMDYQLPREWVKSTLRMRDDLFASLFGYVRALLILMVITFAELSIGFTIARVEYALPLALLIALLDALPVLGTGTLVMPWAIVLLIGGNYYTGVGLIITFLVVWTVRQLIEPHIVGEQIGIHPLITLFSMYIGMHYLGVAGMILGPIVAIVVRNVLKVYMNGRTMREVLYADTDLLGDARVDPPTRKSPGSGFTQKVFKRFTKR